jgi:hypothetical protein
MKETLFIIIFIIVFYVIFIMNDSSLVRVESNGNKILVREAPDKEKSAALLNSLIEKMYQLRQQILNNRDKHPDYQEYIDQFEVNFNKNRTKIYETSLNSEYTSYSVNKGEELVFCLRCKSTMQLHTINLMMYVAVHELAHTACPETGHTPLFNRIFKFMLERAIENKL